MNLSTPHRLLPSILSIDGRVGNKNLFALEIFRKYVFFFFLSEFVRLLVHENLLPKKVIYTTMDCQLNYDNSLQTIFVWLNF
ncbi:hypothetical protein HYC85_021367 [Camellia sinensis]|uniref:Uncharacterized protein n=1 Tax=Camellia sinensis TaxID=4442 RepID=A0A7J7GHG7_CAMSI|nr:hypothetical protein HYC85_021367 [Camellia sinensis]